MQDLEHQKKLMMIEELNRKKVADIAYDQVY